MADMQSYNKDNKGIIVFVIKECKQNNHIKIYIMLLNMWLGHTSVELMFQK